MLSGSGTALALDPAKSFTNYVLDVWQTQDELPHHNVWSVAQTPDGYLWFGNDRGLARFDGVRFTVFDSRNTPGLPSDKVVPLLVDRDVQRRSRAIQGWTLHHL